MMPSASGGAVWARIPSHRVVHGVFQCGDHRVIAGRSPQGLGRGPPHHHVLVDQQLDEAGNSGGAPGPILPSALSAMYRAVRVDVA